MRKVSFLLLMLSMAFIANAQQDLPKFPQVTVEELLKNSYPKDSSAEAYIISNYGNSWVYENADGGTESASQYFVRVKILKQSAFKRATKVIYLYLDDNHQDIEQALEIKGRTYNFNKDVIEIDELRDKDIFKSSYNKSFDKVSFTLPKVKEGSIIEYSYLIRSPFPFKPKDWDFQTDIPCERSEYIFGNPTNFAYRMLMQSCEGKLAEEKCNTSNNFQSCRWLMLDIPAMKKEKYVANLDDYTRKLHFELAEYIVRGMDSAKKLSMDWPDFDRQLLNSDDFGGRIGKVSAFDATAQSIKTQKKDSLELAKEVFQYVQSNFTWDGNKRLFAENSLKEVFNRKTGTSSELNLLLISLLRQVGIAAKPVVISTRDHGRVWKNYPMISRFNYVLASVSIGGQNILLDVTDKNLQWGLLPDYCMVEEGRLLIYNKSYWVPIQTPEKSGSKIAMEFTFGPKDAELESQITYTGMGYQAIDYISRYNELGKDKFIAKLKSSAAALENIKVELDGFSSTDSNSQPVIFLTGKNAEGYNKIDGKIFVKAVPFEGVTEHPFPNADRSFPVDFTYPTEQVITTKYNIPEGYSVAELPKGIKVALPQDGGRFYFSVSQDPSGKEINVTSQILLKRSIYSVDEYQAIRTLYDHVVAKHNQMIVLQKK